MNDLLQSLQDRLSQFDVKALLADDVSVWLAIGCGVCVVLLIGRMLFARRKKAAEEDRLEDIRNYRRQRGVFGVMTEALAAQLPESKKETREFAQLLRQAGLYSPTARASIYAMRFVLLFTPLVIAGVLALAAPLEMTFVIMIGGAVVATAFSIIPRLYVFFRRQRRMREIREGLADMMDMFSMCMGGGMAFSPSLENVARNLTGCPALAEELQILKRHSEVGSMRQALADFANRIDMPEVRQVASLLARGEQLGVRMSKSLLDQADHFRSTRRQLATMHANRAPVFLTFPLLFCFAPAVLILLMSPALLELTDFINPQDGQGYLAGNESLNTGGIVRTLDALDQNISAPLEAN